jgi:hypothetical protein
VTNTGSARPALSTAESVDIQGVPNPWNPRVADNHFGRSISKATYSPTSVVIEFFLGDAVVVHLRD